MFFVYIIKSINSNRYYIGHTSDLEERLKTHIENRSKATRLRGPWELVISHQCNS
jgi:putative endonuclease